MRQPLCSHRPRCRRPHLGRPRSEPYLDKYIRQRDTLRNVDVKENHYIYRRGQKHYELTNHLGNVLSVVTDNHLPVYVGVVLDHYVAQVVQAQDDYAFGAAMEGRSFSISS
ncbi:MAG: hypothetical protein ACK51A_03895 [Sphingobacteriia bacterium]